MSSNEMRAAFAPIKAVPTIENSTAGLAGVAEPDSSAQVSTVRRLLVTNCSSTDFLGVVWALRADASGTKITGQSITTATRIPPYSTLEFLIDPLMTWGLVGSAASVAYSYTLSEV